MIQQILRSAEFHGFHQKRLPFLIGQGHGQLHRHTGANLLGIGLKIRDAHILIGFRPYRRSQGGIPVLLGNPQEIIGIPGGQGQGQGLSLKNGLGHHDPAVCNHLHLGRAMVVGVIQHNLGRQRVCLGQNRAHQIPVYPVADGQV